MTTLSFVKSLDQEQIEYAMKVRKAAEDAGVNPTLALSIAYQESKFRPNVKRGADGEVGMMQILPATGAGLGYSMQDLMNPDKNIEAGVKYIKEALDVTGNDIRLAPIYYNGGPATFNKFASGQDYDKRVDKYVDALAEYGTFKGFDKSQLRDPVAPQRNPLPPVEVKDPDAKKFEQEGQKELTRDEFGLYGGLAGAGASAVAAGAPVATNTAANVIGNILGQVEKAKAQASGASTVAPANATTGTPPAAPAPAGALPSAQPNLTPPVAPGAPAGGLPTGDQSTRILQGTTGDQGTTGRARMTGFNTETSQVATAKNEAEKIAQTLRQSGQVAQDAPEFFAKQPGLTSTPSGVLVPRSDLPQYAGPRGPQGEIGGVRAAEAAARPPYVPPPIPRPSGLDQAKGLFTSMMETGSRAMPYISKAAPYVAAPFAGYSLGRDVADMYMGYEQAPEERDYLDLGLTGLGALATAGSFTPAAPLAIPASIALPAARNLRRTIMEKRQSPEEQEFINTEPSIQELEMAKHPAFRYAKPMGQRPQNIRAINLPMPPRVPEPGTNLPPTEFIGN
jgi:hypothetical protein